MAPNPTFRLLGTVGLWREGRHLGPVTGQQRAVLALLLLDRGHSVAVDRMITALWGTAPPRTARNSVQVQISRLRRFLSPLIHAPVRAVGHGYRLDVPPEEVDLFRFRALVQRARRSDAQASRRLLAQALEEWQGQALADVVGDWLADVVAPNLENERRDVIEELARLEIHAGLPAEAVTRLAPLHAADPLREDTAALLLTALHRSGRRAEALDLFQRVRRRLIDELGIEPGAPLTRAHEDTLRDAPSDARSQDPTGAPQEQRDNGVSTPPFGVKAPRQLPPDNVYFCGREAELRVLDAMVREGADSSATAPAVGVITGIGGVGKTALVVHWAHQMQDHFPDGQLYINLRGFGPSGTPLAAEHALQTFLVALGVSQARIPATQEAQLGLFRSLLAGRRFLVLLDNARDADQVRLLLPSSPSCLVLVTSRHELTSLVAMEGARPLSLAPLDHTGSRRFIAFRLGDDRIDREPKAVDRIVQRCGGLPLALATLSARAVMRPRFALADLFPRRWETETGLDPFAVEDAATNLRAVFSWSHQALDEPAADLFRLLGLHPSPEFSTAAAASLRGCSISEAGRLLSHLAEANLITEVSLDHHVFHDLVWAYANELAQRDVTAERRSAALGRMLAHYLHTAGRADLQINRNHQMPYSLGVAPDDVSVSDIDGTAHALDWFRREYLTMTAAVGVAAEHGFDTFTWQLTRVLRTFLYRNGHFEEQAELHRLALRSATVLKNASAQAYCLFGLGQALCRLHRFDEAGEELRAAQDLYAGLDDHIGQAAVTTHLGVLHGQRGDLESALELCELSLEHSRAAGHRPGEAMALNNVGWFRALLGDYEGARLYCEEALEILRSVGDIVGESATLDSLGYIHRSLKQYEKAIACYEQTLLLRRGQEPVYEAETLPQLAEAQLGAGLREQAIQTLRRALSMLSEYGPRDAEAVRARLAELEEQADPESG
ncbi:tetratricopeptide repeat protein [Nonomuraea sp. NN258]|uniref:AfsR/SARP family transcriptional regulator n=1 Tax=Nonomuraea antri TaxID=2730852 RepID=UPI002E2E205E|nr:BTAD domain-containing putative transcriptional regulator [Nonomuraea antri]NRQ32489.1 tetratricopeptide repeat protein [Nonomuraea antri]